jgi:hypothetical protein
MYFPNQTARLKQFVDLLESGEPPRKNFPPDLRFIKCAKNSGHYLGMYGHVAGSQQRDAVQNRAAGIA